MRQARVIGSGEAGATAVIGVTEAVVVTREAPSTIAEGSSPKKTAGREEPQVRVIPRSTDSQEAVAK